MTTPDDPLDGILLPYAVQFYHGTNAYMDIPVPQRSPSGSTYWHSLPPGVYLLQLSYGGAEQAEIWYEPRGTGSILRIGEIDSVPKPTPRMGQPVKVSVGGNSARIAVVCTPRSNTLSSTAMASISIIPEQIFTP